MGHRYGQFQPVIAYFAQNDPQNGPHLKYQKSKKQVLFVFHNASFLPKMKEYGQNRDEFCCLEANFQTPEIPGLPMHFAKFRKIRCDFVGLYLGVTASFFNSVKRS